MLSWPLFACRKQCRCSLRLPELVLCKLNCLLCPLIQYVVHTYLPRYLNSNNTSPQVPINGHLFILSRLQPTSGGLERESMAAIFDTQVLTPNALFAAAIRHYPSSWRAVLQQLWHYRPEWDGSRGNTPPTRGT